MSLRVPSSDQSISPSPHRQMGHFRSHNASSPRSTSASPSPSASPLKQRRRKLNQFDTFSQDVSNQKSDKTLLKFSPNAPVNGQNAPVYSRSHRQLPHDTSMDSNSDHLMSDATSSSSFSFSSHSSQPFNKNRRPLSESFTNNDPTFSKKLATSYLQRNNTSVSNSFSLADSFPRSSEDVPHPRGLRRSAGLLNLDEASKGSTLARKSSYRLRKSQAKLSPSSVSSDFSKIDLSRHFELSSQRQFKFGSTAPTLPQKRPHSFGSLFGEKSSQQAFTLKPNWNFTGDSTKLPFKFGANPGWNFSQQSRPTGSTSTSFLNQPYFNKSESLSSPFQSSHSFSHLNTPLSPSKPTQKLRKMNPNETTNSSSSHVFSPHSSNFSRFSSNSSTQPSHPLVYSHHSSSPLKSPSRVGKLSQPASPAFSLNFSDTQSPEFSSSVKPSFAFSKPAHKFNSSLELDASIRSSTPEFSTPDSFKFVKPLQTAFMSTGLISKRNRKKPFGDSHMAPPDTPCKKTTLSSTISHFSSIPKKVFSNSFCPSPRAPPSQSSGSGQPSSTSGRVTHNRKKSSIDYGNFNDFLCKEPSTPRKLDNGYSENSTFNYPTLSMSVPTKVAKTISDTNFTVPGPFLSATPNSNNSSSTSINRFSFTPLSQSSKFYDGSPSDMSSPRTPDVTFHGDIPQLALSLNKDSLMQYDNNQEMQDSEIIEAPRTPAKTHKSHHEIAIPSTMMGMERMEQDNASDIVLRERYSDVQMIGTGEFSIVYAGTERAANSGFQPARFAIKRTKFPFVGSKARARRNEEVEILRNLTYSNKSGNEDGREYVVNLIDAWELRGHLYIVTEYCENGNLDSFLSKRGNVSRLDEWRVWKILVELALGLRYIHDEGYVHLDMKPANVFITFEGTLKIGDFGMAAKLPVPRSAEREGDREYIAPEIISSSMYDKPADIFSTGLMMVEIAANIFLPENGVHWQKLRSGDLSDAGRLSSGNLCLNSSNGLNGSHPTGSSSRHLGYYNNPKIPDWAPQFMVDNDGALDKIVEWMTNPDPSQRPSAEQILAKPETRWVEQHRKAGAVVYEGDFGPSPESDIDEPKQADPMVVDEDF